MGAAQLPVLSLIGPTASGKTSLSLDLVQAWVARGGAAEVVNTDSMLVYRGMDIGTAKPSPAERRGIPHHLLDVLEVTDDASVADFQAMARAAIDDCTARGVLPVLVGGSSLYVRAVLDEFDFPATDPALRARLEAEVEELGLPALWQRLLRRAPAAAERMEPGNARRVVRALEVLELTGTFSAALPEPRYHRPGTLQVGLTVDRTVMDARIAERVDRMWADGLVEETRRLEAAGLRRGRTASRALGYRQVLQHLAGEITEDEAREQTVARTRRFARKQLGWFRRDPRIVWTDALAPREEQLSRVLALLDGSRG
ncbi:tRNA (adenosine(37)-N6)-dimethylallyltransferase MiaA [Auraticoccus monumenti]|uniref:tRNA dimethylallyltransferase n=1 Tax=Auraticoccus monumenti TaxID=675864 RepID=A0A1G7CN70_9ACTN|nr:tRNA (adenosine(37)-N6)-dimethylallyltransferase MiaA [Auraticoccus monumenti]SDE39895.1 tRNA dimethylallyltransferase [Auraticoccus monumenti]